MRHAVITYLYGRDEELLRTPKFIEPNIEYICVTDNRNLKSSLWKIKYDPLCRFYNNRLKFAYVKTHPFVYTTANDAVVIDGSMEISKPITPLFDIPCDILFKPHPLRHTLRDELAVWPNRGLSNLAIIKYVIMGQCLGADFQKGPLYETNVSLWHKNINTIMFGEFTHRIMMKLSNRKNVFLSNQLVMSLLLQTRFAHLNIKHIKQQPWFTKYMHGTNVCTKRQD